MRTNFPKEIPTDFPVYKIYIIKICTRITFTDKEESEEELILSTDTSFSEIASFKKEVDRGINKSLKLLKENGWACNIEIIRKVCNKNHCCLKYDRWYARSENGDMDDDGIGFYPDTKYTDEGNTLYWWKDDDFMTLGI